MIGLWVLLLVQQNLFSAVKSFTQQNCICIILSLKILISVDLNIIRKSASHTQQGFNDINKDLQIIFFLTKQGC